MIYPKNQPSKSNTTLHFISSFNSKKFSIQKQLTKHSLCWFHCEILINRMDFWSESFLWKNKFFVSPFICKKKKSFCVVINCNSIFVFQQKPFDTEFILVWLVQIQRVYVCDFFGGHFIVLHISFELVLTIIVIYSLSPCAFVCYDTTKSST